MNEDFICNPIYDQEVFEKVSMLGNNDNWKEIDEFMVKEYLMKWLKFKKDNELMY